MTPANHDDVLKFEQSVNERYLHKFEASAGDLQHGQDNVVAPANTGWTGSGPKKPIPKGPSRPLVGRVALNPGDECLGQSFYVGDGFTPLDDDTIVVSWVAPAADLFYEGREASVRSPEGVDPQTVEACRTFKPQGDRIIGFEDDCEPGVDPSTAFPSAPPLTIRPPPTPPDSAWMRQLGDSTTKRPQPTAEGATDHAERGDGLLADDSRDGGGTPQVAPTNDPSAEPPDIPRGTVDRTPNDASVPPIPAAEAVNKKGNRELRAEGLLKQAIEAPKTGTLAPVLSTLQLEQHQLVAWRHDQNLVVQGHPGTGKTIVAAHRAAYLVLPKDREDQSPRLSRVALVGPTDRWREHIAPTVHGLVDRGVEVLSLESLIRGWSRGSRHALHHPAERELHSRWAIGRIVDAAARAQQSRLRHFKRAERVRELVNSLVQDTDTHRKFVTREGADLSEWLLDAGDYRNARRDPSYLLFLAAAGIVTGWLGVHDDKQHIVVDEVQDIRPVEWWMLSKMFRAGTKERWSLFGDMNQRRSDFTWESWESLADLLQLSDPDSEQLPEPEDLSIGYRSTREILRYAGALLPRGVQKPSALRSGPEPLIQPVGRNQLTITAKETAERLAIRYHKGSVAVIAQHNVGEIERALLKDGWRRDAGDRQYLRQPHRSCRVSIVGPVSARGLEFDAVVVVEPADFKPNLGRHGELYTSLTRANQELIVIHSKAMPRELSGRGNRAG